MAGPAATPKPGPSGARAPPRPRARRRRRRVPRVSFMTGPVTPSMSPAAASSASPYTAYSVSWNLTQRCNLECAPCYMSAHAGADTRGELTTTECRRVMDEIAAVNPNVFLILTGGEPLLRRDVWDVAAYAVAKKFTTVFGTNGVLLREKEARLMREHGVLGASISLDSTDRVKHDAFRRLPGAWDAAVRATRVLTDEGLDFSLHMSVTDWNVKDVPAMIDLARELGAKVLNFFFLVRTGRGRDLTDIDAAAHEEILTYLAKAQGVGQGPPSFVRRMLGMADAAPAEKFEDPWSTPVGRADGLLIRANCAPHFRDLRRLSRGSPRVRLPTRRSRRERHRPAGNTHLRAPGGLRAQLGARGARAARRDPVVRARHGGQGGGGVRALARRERDHAGAARRRPRQVGRPLPPASVVSGVGSRS